jgi:hypothetical protein
MAFLVILYFLKLFVFMVLVYPLSKVSKEAKRLYARMKIDLFWGDLLVIFTEGYIEFLVASFIVIGAPDESNHKGFFTVTFGIFCLSMTMVLLPLALIVLLARKSLEDFRGRNLKTRWGHLFYLSKHKLKLDLAFILLYFFRRILLVCFAFSMILQPGL